MQSFSSEIPWLEVILLGLGGLSAFAALGGTTWDEKTRRMTFRGWTALMCILATFALGAFKETEDWQEQQEKDEMIASLYDDSEETSKLLSQAIALLENLQEERNELAEAVTEGGRSNQVAARVSTEVKRSPKEGPTSNQSISQFKKLYSKSYNDRFQARYPGYQRGRAEVQDSQADDRGKDKEEESE
ncbi:Hypothetical protein PBC10988_27280 [Planctomycetales bacterium 10988]|nr:Hypothetical protein PBC10988_27280 [Planctomycetales bacterium 10988]